MSTLFFTFKQYLKTKVLYFSFLIVATLIFLCVFFLYGLPLEPILYAAIICFFLGLIFLSLAFISYYKKHLLLSALHTAITSLPNTLPEPKGLLEADYQALLKVLCEHELNMLKQSELKETELKDYYTLWAHQIKTPIAALRLLLQEKSLTFNGPEMQELFKIERYVEMAIQYLRLDSLNQDLVLQPYLLSDLVGQALKKYAPVFIHKKLNLKRENLDVMIVTDEKWFVFVLEQLLSNALKYTVTGSITFSMSPNYVLTLSDTGIGIRKEDQKRVFERGFTGYNGRVNQTSTGLGLYLCKKILSRLGHPIALTSTVDKGTQVAITLIKPRNYSS